MQGRTKLKSCVGVELGRRGFMVRLSVGRDLVAQRSGHKRFGCKVRGARESIVGLGLWAECAVAGAQERPMICSLVTTESVQL